MNSVHEAQYISIDLRDSENENGMRKNGLQSILESLQTLQKETAKLDYRMKIIEGPCSHPISSYTVDRINGEISGSISLEDPSLFFDLPLKTKEEADEFESKLQEKSFRNSIVSLIFIIKFFLLSYLDKDL